LVVLSGKPAAIGSAPREARETRLDRGIPIDKPAVNGTFTDMNYAHDHTRAEKLLMEADRGAAVGQIGILR